MFTGLALHYFREAVQPAMGDLNSRIPKQ